MFDGKMDFENFEKIKVNIGGKFSCKKIFKKKLFIFIIICLLTITILGLITHFKLKKRKDLETNIKNNQTKKTQLLEEIKDFGIKIDDQNFSLRNSQSDLNGKKNRVNNEKENEKKANIKKSELEKKKSDLLKELDDIKKEPNNINKYQDEKQKLEKEIEDLKEEFDKMEEKGIFESKILNKKNRRGLESQIQGTIVSKCFDNSGDNLDKELFKEKCGDNPVLILFSTDSDEQIAAFYWESFFKEQKGEKLNLLCNINKGTCFGKAGKDIVGQSDDDFIHFGDDLIIEEIGTGTSHFPSTFGNRDKDKSTDLFDDSSFAIKRLEAFICKE